MNQDVLLPDGKQFAARTVIQIKSNVPRTIQPIVTRFASHAEAEKSDRAWWRSLSPLERLQQLELARQYAYGSESTKRRLPRLPNLSQRSWR